LKVLSKVIAHLKQSAQRGMIHLRAHTALVQLTGVVFCVPPLIFPTHVPQWAIHGALIGLALLLFAGYLLAGRPIIRTPVDVLILLLLLLLPMTIFITPDHDLTLPHVYKVIGSVALFYGVVGVLEDESWFGLSALTISALGLVLALLTLFGTKWSTAKLPWLPFDLYQLFPRLIRPFWNPKGFNSNITGGTLAMLLPVPMAYLFFGHRLLIRLVALLGVGVVSLVLLLTQSRSAMVALAAGIATMLVIHNWRWLVAVVLVAIMCALVLRHIGVDGLLTSASDAAAGSAVRSLQGRLELWSRGWMMLQDFPFTGIGFGAVVKVMPVLYPTFVVPNDAKIEHVHSLFLEAGVDLGFPGLIATLAFLLGLFYLSWCAARRARGTRLEPLALGMLGVLVVFAVHGITDNLTFYARGHFIAWALFGVAVAVGMRLIHDEGFSIVDAASR
jgi:O-antigen ligase